MVNCTIFSKQRSNIILIFDLCFRKSPFFNFRMVYSPFSARIGSNLSGPVVHQQNRIEYALSGLNTLFKSNDGFYGLCLFVCIEVLRPSQPNGVMSSAVSLPSHTFTEQA